MPYEDKNFRGSSVLDFGIWGRHVKTIYSNGHLSPQNRRNFFAYLRRTCEHRRKRGQRDARIAREEKSVKKITRYFLRSFPRARFAFRAPLAFASVRLKYAKKLRLFCRPWPSALSLFILLLSARVDAWRGVWIYAGSMDAQKQSARTSLMMKCKYCPTFFAISRLSNAINNQSILYLVTQLHRVITFATITILGSQRLTWTCSRE